MTNDFLARHVKAGRICGQFIILAIVNVSGNAFRDLAFGHMEDIGRVPQRQLGPENLEYLIARYQRIVYEIEEQIAWQGAVPTVNLTTVGYRVPSSEGVYLQLWLQTGCPGKQQIAAAMLRSQDDHLVAVHPAHPGIISQQARINRQLRFVRQIGDRRVHELAEILILRNAIQLIQIEDNAFALQPGEIGRQRFANIGWRFVLQNLF